ncbi:MAG: hypothetical protein E6149_04005 [Peptoniphilus harei]|nr:hypothetical protein [Peptoniphilus harei]
MKGIHYIIAVIVIVCLIFWRKSIVNKRVKGQKSIDSSSKAKNNSKKEDLHKISEAKSSEKTSASKLTEVKEKEAYDGSRKKDRGKKRRQKKNTNSAIDEIKKKTEEVKEKTEAEAKKLERKAEAKVEEVKKEAKEIKEKAEVKAEKVTEEVKEKAQDVKKEAEVKTEEVKEEVSKESKKIQAKAKELKVETQAKAEEVKSEAKEIKEKAEVKAEKVTEEVKEKAQDVKKEAELKTEEVKEEVKEKAQAVKEEVKEDKVEIENKIASTGNYPDLITSLKNNPWTSSDLNTRVKFEDIRRQVTLHEDEITDLPLDKIKTSLSPESLVDFLNMTSAKPTILNRKEDTSYEFTTRDPKEIDLIKKRYGLLDREIDKITSVLIFDNEGQKLKEVKDVLAEGKNRIYMETKF